MFGSKISLCKIRIRISCKLFFLVFKTLKYLVLFVQDYFLESLNKGVILGDGQLLANNPWTKLIPILQFPALIRSCEQSEKLLIRRTQNTLKVYARTCSSSYTVSCLILVEIIIGNCRQCPPLRFYKTLTRSGNVNLSANQRCPPFLECPLIRGVSLS